MSEPPQRPSAGAGTAVASAASAVARPSVIQLVFREKGALYAAYMPLFAEGGLFVPTTREYKLGEDIYLLLSLPEDPQRYPVAGKVGWITPANASGGRTQGVGESLGHGSAGEIGRLPKFGLGGGQMNPQVWTQPIPDPVHQQSANMVHMHVGQYHVGHGRQIDAGGLQSLDQLPGPRQVQVRVEP
jgi:type IV pilus assembly protein PilZ